MFNLILKPKSITGTWWQNQKQVCLTTANWSSPGETTNETIGEMLLLLYSVGCLFLDQLPSVFVLADTLVTSPQIFFIFIIKNNIRRFKLSKHISVNYENNITATFPWRTVCFAEKQVFIKYSSSIHLTRYERKQHEWDAHTSLRCDGSSGILPVHFNNARNASSAGIHLRSVFERKHVSTADSHPALHGGCECSVIHLTFEPIPKQNSIVQCKWVPQTRRKNQRLERHQT